MVEADSYTAAPALDIASISGGYGEAMVVRDIALAIQPGEICTVLGKNGMGKSTLLKLSWASCRSAAAASGCSVTTSPACHRTGSRAGASPTRRRSRRYSRI
jgi:ABC-type branched-subunit amino acid transport system ATPase component